MENILHLIYFRFNKLKKYLFFIRTSISKFITLFALILITSSCMLDQPPEGLTNSPVFKNLPSTVPVGHGRILKDNPYILSGKKQLSPNVNLGQFLKPGADFITYNETLEESCESISSCYKVLKDKNKDSIQSNNGKWAFNPKSKEFLEVHTFGHKKKIITKFHDTLKEKISYAQSESITSDLTSDLFTSSKYKYWRHNLDGTSDNNETLTTYATCSFKDNAFFSPTTMTLCLGHSSQYKNFYFSQDPTIIYHEMGHLFNQILLNVNNTTTGIDLGDLFYDEAGSIGEGLADFFSYFMNKRPHVFEWALGLFLNASRPLKETDRMHAPGIDSSDDSRLSYPNYLCYDPNNPNDCIEDVHYAGQIIGHFLVALTEDFTSYCGIEAEESVKNTFWLISESLAEMGQLSNPKVNLGDSSNDHSTTWARSITPINFRRFSQTMARKTLQIFGNQNHPRCGTTYYPQQRIEQLWDKYGLLLFRTYNDNLNHENQSSDSVTNIDGLNRKKTILLDKELLKLDPDPLAPSAFVFDSRSDMISLYNSLRLKGKVELTSQIETDFPYNNGNGRLSPGELVGISLNLYNNSNAAMAGIQVLGNDWDHVHDASSEPCNTFEDNFPLLNEGGHDSTSETAPYSQGDCNYITKDNGTTGNEIAPICFIQKSDSSSTKWILQEKFREHIGLSKSECLSGSSDTKDCFIRVMKGADHSFYSKIDPKKTWAQTFSGETGAPIFSSGNIILMEISPWIPPGTSFLCRFRARFTNCDNCWHDQNKSYDDYLDYEYSGGKPFKIIHFKFSVID